MRMDVPEPKPTRGWVSLYAAAFALVLIGGGLLVVAALGQLRSIGLLWVSAASSIAAAGLAIASVLLPRRR